MYQRMDDSRSLFSGCNTAGCCHLWYRVISLSWSVQHAGAYHFATQIVRHA